MPSMRKLLPGDLLKTNVSFDGEAILWDDDDSRHVKPEHELGTLSSSSTLLALSSPTGTNVKDVGDACVLVLSPIGIGFVLVKYVVLL